MRATLRLLVELARLDHELASVEQAQAQLPEARARLEAARAAGEARLEAARSECAAAEARQRQLEGELADAEALRGRLETQQYEVTSRDAYRALLHEMGRVREEVSSHESEILELMDVVENGRVTLRALEAEVAAAEARLAVEERSLEERGEELAAESTRLGRERAERAEKLEPGVRERYERTAAHHRPAVVVVEEEICPACRVGLPPQLVIEMRAARSLATCATCHRILVHRHALEG